MVRMNFSSTYYKLQAVYTPCMITKGGSRGVGGWVGKARMIRISCHLNEMVIMNFSSTYYKLQAGYTPCMITKGGSRTFQTTGGEGANLAIIFN